MELMIQETHHRINNPIWQAWSAAVACAERQPVGTPQEMRAWENADALWAQYQAEVRDYEQTVSEASYRQGAL